MVGTPPDVSPPAPPVAVLKVAGDAPPLQPTEDAASDAPLNQVSPPLVIDEDVQTPPMPTLTDAVVVPGVAKLKLVILL